MNRKQRRVSQKGNPVPTNVRSVDAINSRLSRALACHQAGGLAEAGMLYRQVLVSEANNPDALHLLGVLSHQLKQPDQAIRLIRRAIALNGMSLTYRSNLGNMLRELGWLRDALSCYRTALVLKPDLLDVQIDYGASLTATGRLGAAGDCYVRACALRPDSPEAHNNLGAVRSGRPEAVDHFRAAIVIKPDYADAWNNLGNMAKAAGNRTLSLALYRHALAVQPNFPDALTNVGEVFWQQGRLKDAAAYCLGALVSAPQNASGHNNLGNIFKDQGRFARAAGCYARTIILDPSDAKAHSNFLLSLNYRSDLPQHVVLAEHRRWNELHGRQPSFHHDTARDALRRLRVGYVSPDFRRHSVAYFCEPLLQHHDPDVVEIFCYAEVARPDAVTERLMGLADHWRSTVGMSDAALAAQIVADDIDILVDLAGHTANNRLPVFAAKPAPLQVTWLGYPNTTGLAAMDYRLVDAVTDPPGNADNCVSEHLLRLEKSFLCYGPPVEAPLPMLRASNEPITFGSFNYPAKISDEALDVWVKLLNAVPRSRLLLKGQPFADGGTRDLFQERLAQRGVALNRVTLLGQLPDPADHLGLYGKIDIALDTFPYNGTTTTCEALWMGVPVVTLRGERHVGRVGSSLLTCVGLEELVARDAEDYVAIAAGLATMPTRLREMQTKLRGIMASSALCDGAAFARRVEMAYRDMWRARCGAKDLPLR